MEETATRIVVADFAPSGQAGMHLRLETVMTRAIAGTGRQPVPCGETGNRKVQEPACTTNGWRDDDARRQRIEQKEFPEDGGQCRRAGFDRGRSGRGRRNRSIANWPSRTSEEADRIRLLPARGSWSWRILCRERTRHPSSRAAIRFPSSQFLSPWRTGHCNRVTRPPGFSTPRRALAGHSLHTPAESMARGLRLCYLSAVQTRRCPAGGRGTRFKLSPGRARDCSARVEGAAHALRCVLELAPTERGAIMRFTFEESGQAGVFIDLPGNMPRRLATLPTER